MKLLRRMNRCRSGAAAIEFAIVGTVFALLSIGIVEFGRGLHLRNQIAYVADLGTRKVMIDPNITDAALDSTIRGAFKRGDPALLEITITNVLTGSSPRREILIRYPLVLLIPGLSTNSITLRVARRIPLI